MMSRSIDSIRVKVRLNLKKITMNIKFPCSLTLQLKHDSTQDLKKMYPLRNGECTISQTVEFQCSAPYSNARMRFEDRKIYINTFMVSGSGKVASGTVVFSLMGKENNMYFETVQFLDKCPDKQAKLYFGFTPMMVSRAARKSQSGSRDGSLVHQLSTQRHSPSKDKQRERSREWRRDEIKTYGVENLQNKVQRVLKRHSYDGDLMESDVKQVIASPSPRASRERTPIQTTINTLREFELGSGTNRHSLPTQRMVTGLKSLTADTPKGRSKPIRHRTDISETIEEEEEYQRLKDKIKALELNQRKTLQNLREYKDESQKKKNRISLLEVAKSEWEETVRMKEDRLKRTERALNEANLTKEQLTNQVKNIKGQLQVRQVSWRQQVKKIEDKYRQSEGEREKILEEYNRTLKTIEQSQKRHQSLLRDKERVHHEEKQRHNRRVQQLQQNIAQRQRLIKDLRFEAQQRQKGQAKLTQGQGQLEDELTSTHEEVERLKGKLKAEVERNRLLTDELQAAKQMEAEKGLLKKKLQESSLQCTTLTQKCNKQQKAIQSLQETLNECESQLQKRNAEKSQLTSKLTQIKRSYEQSRSAQEQRGKEINSLQQLNQHTNSRMTEMKAKLELERRSLEQMQEEFEVKYSLLLHEKSTLQNEVEEYRWEVERNKVATSQLNNALKQAQQEGYILSQQIIQSKERSKKEDEERVALLLAHDTHVNQITQLERKTKESQAQMKELQFQVSQLTKSSHQQQHTLNETRQKAKMTESTLKQKLSLSEHSVGELSASVKEKEREIKNLKEELTSRKGDLSQAKQQATAEQQQISHLKEMLDSMRGECGGQQSMILRLKESEADLNSRVEDLNRQVADRDHRIRQLEGKWSRGSNDWRQSSESSEKTIETFLKEVLRLEDEERSSVRQISTHSNHIIAELQVSLYQRTQQRINKYHHSVNTLTEQNEAINHTLSKCRVELEELKQRYQDETARLSDKIKALSSDLSQKQEESRSFIVKLEETLSSRDKTIESGRVDSMHKQEQTNELRAQLEILLVQYEALKHENRDLQERIMKQKAEVIKQKAGYESKQREVESELEKQQSRNRQLSLQQEKRWVLIQKELGEKAEMVHKYEAQVHSLKCEYETKSKAAEELEGKVREQQGLIAGLERKIKQIEKESKRSGVQIEKTEGQLSKQQQIAEELTLKTQELEHIILESSRQLEASRQECMELAEKTSRTEQALRHKFEVERATNQKLSGELKEVKQAKINAFSALQLKEFMLRQVEASLRLQQDLVSEQQEEISSRKNTISALNQQIITLNTENKAIKQSLVQTEQERETIRGQLDTYRGALAEMEPPKDAALWQEQLEALEKENSSLRKTQLDGQDRNDRQIQDLKGQLRDTKRNLNVKQMAEQQLKKKVRVIEKMIESKSSGDVGAERKRFLFELQREQRDFLFKLQQAEQKHQQTEDELQGLQNRHRKEVDKLASENQNSKLILKQKEGIMRNQQMEYENVKFENSDLAKQKMRLEGELDKVNRRVKQVQDEAERQVRVLREQLRQMEKQQGGEKEAISEIERRLSRVKLRRLQGVSGQMQRTMLNSWFRDMEQIVTSASRERRH